MYIDCPTCGFESDCFILVGDVTLEQMAPRIGCTAGGDQILCPQGHAAVMCPTEWKFWKRSKWYVPAQISNGPARIANARESDFR